MTSETKAALNPVEKFLSLFTKVYAGEGASVTFLFLNSFFLLLAYYLLKPVREALVLSQGGAELRSYAVAAQAVLLLCAIPLYGALFRHTQRLSLLRWITFFFASNLLIFFALGKMDVNIGVAFFIWLGILSVTLVAQFWAFTADLYNVEAGHRLFAFIAVGSTLGSLVGSEIAKVVYAQIGTFGLMLVSAGILCGTVVLSSLADSTVPSESRNQSPDQAGDNTGNFLSGFSIVLRDRYLLLIAIFVLLLNCINSTGEFILAKVIVEQAEALVAADPSQQLSKGAAIGSIYGNFYFWVNLITLLVQLLLVRRIWQLIGIRGALMILPLIVLFGYGTIAFLPVFSIIYWVKIAENSADYSVQSTTRHALFLPVSRAKKYQGKTCIDTFVWRLGDLIQALLVYLGLNMFGFGIIHFAMVNFMLSLLWLAVAAVIGIKYSQARPQS